MRFAKPLFAALALGVMLAAASEALSVDGLLKDAQKHDGKPVTVTGKIVEFQQKTSRAGNKYFTLQLRGTDGNVNVYGRGELAPAPKKDDRVEAAGIFRREKKVQTFTVKNEVDVSPVEGKKYGVKLLKE